MKYLLGLGNYSMGDDGIGLRIVEHIADNGLDEGFEAVEIGNNGMQALTYFEESTDRIVVVDATQFGGTPGDVIVFSPEDVETHKVTGTISTHEGDLLKLIELARSLEQHIPPIRIVAIEPEAMPPDMEITPTLQARFQEYVAVVLGELNA